MSRVQIDKTYVYIDGVPTKIVSGAMHYFRIHPEYWRDRLLKLKEMGCNCVETYLAWNLHEKNEGEFDFSGWLDFGAYLDIAKELGLYAIVRPGPYICSELDLGGLPWWLLRYDNIALRTSQPLFLEKITPFLKKACEMLSPRMIDAGGNIIFVQVENEFGSYTSDPAYLQYLKELLMHEGVSCPLITSDGALDMLLDGGGLPDVMASVNYRWESESALALLKRLRPNQPGAVMELWNGRAQHWGKPALPRDLDEVADSLEKALLNASLVNLYMFHGGTTFGFMNGMVYHGKTPVFQMTSYDVDAPLDEYGRRTEKYYREQAVIAKVTGKTAVSTLKDPHIHCYGAATLVGTAQLTKEQVTSVHKAALPCSMEHCGQGYGYIVYEAEILLYEGESLISLPEMRDIAHVYLDGCYQGTLTAEDPDATVTLRGKGKGRLSILVENLGRCNHGSRLAERKGLLSPALRALYRGKSLQSYSVVTGYTIYTLPIETLPAQYDVPILPNAPAFYRYEFDAEVTADTLLSLSGFTRGVAFINGFNLGRHWTIENSQNKLFIPAPLIKHGRNELVIFDVLATEKDKIVFLGE